MSALKTAKVADVCVKHHVRVPAYESAKGEQPATDHCTLPLGGGWNHVRCSRLIPSRNDDFLETTAVVSSDNVVEYVTGMDVAGQVPLVKLEPEAAGGSVATESALFRAADSDGVVLHTAGAVSSLAAARPSFRTQLDKCNAFRKPIIFIAARGPARIVQVRFGAQDLHHIGQ